MLTYTTRTDKILSNTINRLGKSRYNRYVDFTRPIQNAEMHKIYKEFFEWFVNNKSFEENIKSYILSLIESNKESMEFRKGLIGILDGEYVVVFMGVSGIDTSVIKITYNDSERILFRRFLDKYDTHSPAMDAFLIMTLKLLTSKQIASLIKNETTTGMMYANYPEVDKIIDHGFIRYTTDSLTKGIAYKSGIDATFNAINRGVSIEEIEAVFPDDPEARLFAREFTEMEVAQLNALERGISEIV